MRALFLGTPAAAVATLAALTGVADVVAVVTQPDAARGRSKHLVAPPVRVAAEEWGIPVFQPDGAAELQSVADSIEFDIGVVVAFGRILSPELLASSPYGFLNVHFSLLPRWRGAAPVERAILSGDETTGVAIMQLDAGMDTGPVIAVREVEIFEDDTAGLLTARLSHIGADLLIDSLNDYAAGRRQPAPQISGGATVAPRLTTAEAQLHGEIPVGDAERMVRGFNPRPGAWMLVDGERVKVFAARRDNGRVPPGTVAFPDSRPLVGFRGGALELTRVQPAGQRPMTGIEWGNGRRHQPGVIAAASG
jgi:methionyl-tRNA formyltransferase